MPDLALEEVLVLNRSLDEAGRAGRLMELPTLAALREAAAAFIPPDDVPACLEVEDPRDDFFAIAVVTPGPGLEVGDCAGPVSCDGVMALRWCL